VLAELVEFPLAEKFAEILGPPAFLHFPFPELVSAEALFSPFFPE